MIRVGSHVRRGRSDLLSVVTQSEYGFDPRGITNLYLWLDAADTSTITASGNAVSQWNEKITGLNVSQATSTAQPQTGVSALNGLNVIDFGGNDYLTYSSSTDSIDVSSASWFVVAKASPLSGRLFSFRTGATNRYDYASPNFHVRVNSPSGLIRQGNTVDNVNTAGGAADSLIPAIDNVWFMTDGVIAGTTNAVSIDKTPDGRVTRNTTTSQRHWRIGASNEDLTNPPPASGFLTGSIAEVLVYNRQLQLSERRAVRRYLANKWRVPNVVLVADV